jgi:hypothetical protein
MIEALWLGVAVGVAWVGYHWPMQVLGVVVAVWAWAQGTAFVFGWIRSRNR